MFILWRLRLVACGLCLGAWRLGACSFWPLIMIRGPNFSHPLLMILSSAAMVCSCGPEAWLTSIVNFFIDIASIAFWKHVHFFLFWSTRFPHLALQQRSRSSKSIRSRQTFSYLGSVDHNGALDSATLAR